MSCNNLGNFAIATDATNLCYSALTTTLYGNGLTIGSSIFVDSGCSSGYFGAYFSDGVSSYYVNLSGNIEQITDCCDQVFCVQNDTIYDDNYLFSGIYDSQPYYTGQTTGYFIYYSSGETKIGRAHV